jgi:hypothetical protein
MLYQTTRYPRLLTLRVYHRRFLFKRLISVPEEITELRLPMDHRVVGLLRDEVKEIVDVLPALTVTVPEPASSSPWNSVTV